MPPFELAGIHRQSLTLTLRSKPNFYSEINTDTICSSPSTIFVPSELQ